MAHNVICYHCGTRFDRDKEEYVQVNGRRYAHAACALREAEKNSTPIPEVINPLDNVICIYCKKPMHRQKDADCVRLNERKYAHQACIDLEEKRELTDQEKLDKYIMQLFKIDYVHQKIKRQINDYIEKYNFTYSGIQKALVYFYDVKQNSLDKSHGGIGIVPYVYKEAFDYYFAIWEAKQKNEFKLIEEYVPEDVVIHIPVPQRKIKKRKIFTFLDEEETDGQ